MSNQQPSLFSFPDPVNETSARVVAAGVVAMSLGYLATGWWPLLAALVYGFLARVATGPTLSPLGRIATEVVTPRLDVEHRFVPGPPKRFAQAIGLTVSVTAAVAALLGAPLVAAGAVAMLVIAAGLEAGFAVCLGCIIYDRIWGCPECADISRRVSA